MWNYKDFYQGMFIGAVLVGSLWGLIASTHSTQEPRVVLDDRDYYWCEGTVLKHTYGTSVLSLPNQEICK